MSKVININGMAVKVIDNTEKQETLSQEDKDMEKLHLKKPKYARNPLLAMT